MQAFAEHEIQRKDSPEESICAVPSSRLLCKASKPHPGKHPCASWLLATVTGSCLSSTPSPNSGPSTTGKERAAAPFQKEATLNVLREECIPRLFFLRRNNKNFTCNSHPLPKPVLHPRSQDKYSLCTQLLLSTTAYL